MKTIPYTLAALWNLLVLVVAGAVLIWFLYWFGLRRVIRAKHISALRERRMLREAAERESNDVRVN